MKKLLGLSLIFLGLSAQAERTLAPESVCARAELTQNLSKPLKNASLICLDSVQSAQSERTIFVQSTPQDLAQSVYVVDTRLDGDRPAEILSVRTFSNPDLFPTGCGAYLIGARVLPGSSKIAMIYARSVVRVLSLADGLILDVFDKRPDGMGATCEGFIPNKDAGRKEVLVHSLERTLEISYFNFENLSEVCFDLTDREIAGIQKSMEWARTVVSDLKQKLEVAVDPKEKQSLEQTIKGLEDSLKDQQKSLDTNQRCGLQAAKETGFLKY